MKVITTIAKANPTTLGIITPITNFNEDITNLINSDPTAYYLLIIDENTVFSTNPNERIVQSFCVS
jgi:hypothetical protein